MAEILVDSNVLLDVMTEDPNWFDWSSSALQKWGEMNALIINPVIYAEASIRFETVEEFEAALMDSRLERRAIPWEAAFLAGKCFTLYRRRRGLKTPPLSDFFIGAHTLVAGMSLLTRNPAHYRAWFPRLRLIAPS